MKLNLALNPRYADYTHRLNGLDDNLRFLGQKAFLRNSHTQEILIQKEVFSF